MNQAVSERLIAPLPATRGVSGWRHVYRIELRKVGASLPARVVAVVCCLGPFGFAAVLSTQSSVPADSLFGRWVHASGFAVPLVILSFAGTWGFPLLAGILAGDMFSAEDRYNTWKALLTRSCTRRDIFTGKLLAAAACSSAMVTVLALTSVLAGVLLVGDQPLVSLGGTLLSPGHAAVLTLAAWGAALPPVLAFTALALLFSVITRSAAAGVLGPAVVALVMQLLSLVGAGVVTRTLLAGSAFDAWHGLFTEPSSLAALTFGAIVCAAWVVGCVGLGWLILRRRDFAAAHATRAPGWGTPIRVVALGAAVIGVLIAAGRVGPPAITPSRLENAIAPTFSNLTILQQRQLGRTVPAGASLQVTPTCTRRGAATGQGPGDDWRCSLSLIRYTGNHFYPDTSSTTVTYDVKVKADACYTAQSPPAFVGPMSMRDARGHSVVNPLFAFDGCFATIP